MSQNGASHLRTYFMVFATLMALTGLTVYVAYADLGAFSAPVAVAIACVKATLVILFFMHVRYETRLIGLYAISGFAFFLILVVLTMGEVAGRDARPTNPRLGRFVAPGINPPSAFRADPGAAPAPPPISIFLRSS